MSFVRSLSIGQGLLYVATGLWPIFHLKSFEDVTGPKTDDWLVRTVGGLVTALGAGLLVAAKRNERSRALRVIAGGSAAVLAVIDVVYATRGRISRVYLADAAVETAIAGGWLAARAR